VEKVQGVLTSPGRQGGPEGCARARSINIGTQREKARMDHGAYPMRRALTRTLELSMLLMPESIGT